MKRFIHTTLAAAILALPTTALAADHEISVELGSTTHTADDNWFLFADGDDAITSFGARAGFAVHDNIAVIAGYHRARTGTRVEMEGVGTVFDEEGMYANMAAAYYADTYSLGAKVDWPIAVWFHPYATVQGLGIRSMVRLDDDTSTDDNPNQLQRAAFSPGGAAAGGVEFRVPINHNEWALASHLELGYHIATPGSFDELGELTNRGLFFRWGLGARF